MCVILLNDLAFYMEIGGASSVVHLANPGSDNAIVFYDWAGSGG